MASQRILLDTNILVRFFTGDPPDQAKRARALIGRADEGELTLVIPTVILAETFYTLESFYKMPQREVADKLALFLQCRDIESPESEIVLDALNRCGSRNVHLSDALLAAYAAQSKIPVASFDHDFEKFADVTRVDVK